MNQHEFKNQLEASGLTHKEFAKKYGSTAALVYNCATGKKIVPDDFFDTDFDSEQAIICGCGRPIAQMNRRGRTLKRCWACQ